MPRCLCSTRHSFYQPIISSCSLQRRRMADCRGKSSWPELVGFRGRVAAEIIERENPFVRARVIPENAVTLTVVLCDNVYVRVNSRGIVVRIPQVG
ncbi:glu S.griseus protease inhibitor-like [Wolffia australiana]